jgi:hypothetical protein
VSSIIFCLLPVYEYIFNNLTHYLDILFLNLVLLHVIANMPVDYFKFISSVAYVYIFLVLLP